MIFVNFTSQTDIDMKKSKKSQSNQQKVFCGVSRKFSVKTFHFYAHF